jgi:signal transduction histidine kinase
VSFRLRVLALVALVGVTATAVTAWLTLQQASRQVNEPARAQQQDIERITEEITAYGQAHGTWEGVAETVAQLATETGQRIQLTTAEGTVVVDTDTLEGRTARAVNSPAYRVDPRPTLDLPAGASAGEVILGTLMEIDRYRSGILLAACLTRAGLDVVISDGPYGVPHYAPDPSLEGTFELDYCLGFATVQDTAREQDASVVDSCANVPVEPIPPVAELTPDRLTTHLLRLDLPAVRREGGTPSATEQSALRSCLSGAFADRTQEGQLAPVSLYAYLGAVDGPATVSPWPILAAAGLVAALAVAGSMLVSRRVAQPIRVLTGASYRLGKGDLSERVPVVGRDELAGLAASFNRMADSLQRGEERQRRLIADVAHELRTPLANLRGYLEALKDGVVRPDAELFASLHEEAVLQQRIVDDLQDLALAEAGTLVYHRSQVDLAELLETCRTAHQAVAEAAGVRLVLAADAPGCVDADPDRLRQVLGNLVGNALRATPAGGSVTLATRREGDSAVVTVTDTGSGIAAEHLPYVFDRFWRADAARGRTTGGSGLGLAIVRQIVTDHGGTIEVASRLGQGTTFRIELPIDPTGAGGSPEG